MPSCFASGRGCIGGCGWIFCRGVYTHIKSFPSFFPQRTGSSSVVDFDNGNDIGVIAVFFAASDPDPDLPEEVGN